MTNDTLIRKEWDDEIHDIVVAKALSLLDERKAGYCRCHISRLCSIHNIGMDLNGNDSEEYSIRCDAFSNAALWCYEDNLDTYWELDDMGVIVGCADNFAMSLAEDEAKEKDDSLN